MMKKRIPAALCLTLALALLTGYSCAAEASPAGAPQLSGELNVFVWTEYMPQSVFDEFTKETGVKVNVSTYSSNEDMLAKVKASNKGIYDIVVPTDYMVKMMIEQDLLAKLDKDNIPNLANIGSQFLDQPFDPGNAYSVPYMGGVATLCVNTDRVTEDITSYQQLFDGQYDSSMVALDDFRAVIGMVAKSLGYSMSETDPEKLSQISQKLMALKPTIKALDSDSPKSLMIGGETSIGFMWNAEIALSRLENPAIQIVFPQEGAYLFLDSLCVLDGAVNKENAEAFLNFLLRPEISKLVSDEFPYLNPNTEAVKLLGDDYLGNPASNIPPEVFETGEYIQDVGSAIDLYSDMWTKFTQ